jgi:hypothetical protein
MIDELLERERRAEEIGGDVLESGLVLGRDGLAHEGRETRVAPGLQFGHEELGHRVLLEEAGEEVPAKQDHQALGVPFVERTERPIRGERPGGREYVKVWMPLNQVSGARQSGDEAGLDTATE